MNWLDICALEEINILGSRIINGPKGDIAIFRTSDDEVFALDDRCPHKGGPLSPVSYTHLTLPTSDLV